MALISCPDCGTEISDAAPACLKCGRPIASPNPATSPAPKKRNTHPVTWLVFVAIVAVVAYKFYFTNDTKQAINLVAASTGITITPWIDRAQSGLEVQLEMLDQRNYFGRNIVAALHPTGTFETLSNHRFGRNGNTLQLEFTASWKGGILGTPYSTTVVWEFDEKGHIKTFVAKDNGPFGFEQGNLDVLDKWFRTEIWPIVDRAAGS